MLAGQPLLIFGPAIGGHGDQNTQALSMVADAWDILPDSYWDKLIAINFFRLNFRQRRNPCKIFDDHDLVVHALPCNHVKGFDTSNSWIQYNVVAEGDLVPAWKKFRAGLVQ